MYLSKLLLDISSPPPKPQSPSPHNHPSLTITLPSQSPFPHNHPPSQSPSPHNHPPLTITLPSQSPSPHNLSTAHLSFLHNHVWTPNFSSSKPHHSPTSSVLPLLHHLLCLFPSYTTSSVSSPLTPPPLSFPSYTTSSVSSPLTPPFTLLYLADIALIAGSNKTLEVHDLNVGQCVCAIEDVHSRPVNCIAQNKVRSFYSHFMAYIYMDTRVSTNARNSFISLAKTWKVTKQCNYILCMCIYIKLLFAAAPRFPAMT